MLAVTVALLLTAAPSRIAVMPVVAGDAVPERATTSLTDQLAAELRRQSGVEVLTPRDVGGALVLDRLKQSPGCPSDPSLAEVATAAGADRLVIGELSRLGESLLFHLRLLDARSVKALAISDRRFRRGAYDDLLDALPGMIRELLRAAPDPAPASNDRFVLHYHREDGRYEASLHVWETFEGIADLRRAVPVVWDTRVPTVEPDGHDDFGVLWILPAARFRNGRVNFQIQQGGTWDECVKIAYKAANPLHYSGMELSLGSAPYWLLSDGREAWINAPECVIHPTLERALKSQRRPARGR